MLYVNEKYFNSYSQLWKDNFLQNWQFEKCDMTSINLEKILQYRKIQESLRNENLTRIVYVNE